MCIRFFSVKQLNVSKYFYNLIQRMLIELNKNTKTWFVHLLTSETLRVVGGGVFE